MSYLGKRIYPLWPIDGDCKKYTAQNSSRGDREDKMPAEGVAVTARGWKRARRRKSVRKDCVLTEGRGNIRRQSYAQRRKRNPGEFLMDDGGGRQEIVHH